ncbi:formylglycine-generating enzyme family protein [Candidatus Poribacteria bacterium]|nr:formylglycine-generating enzyme family protein [Candidatus Poribacteria bacterium]
MKTKIPLLIITSAIIIAMGSGYELTQNVIPKSNPTNATMSAPTSSNDIAPGELLERIVSPKDGASMVLIPAGEFLMGSSDAQVEQILQIKPGIRELIKHEQPQHRVYLDAFYIDQYEVTNAQFQKFVKETGYVTDAEREGWGYLWEGFNDWPRVKDANWRSPRGVGSSIVGKADHPVIQVSYNDALAYALWAGKRLPTEAEWEKASRGTDGRLYPWGDDWDANKVNSWERGPHTTMPVGSYPTGVSPYQVYDMVGNVWEWVTDWYHHIYYHWSPDHNPTGPSGGTHRVLRGGCWLNQRCIVRCAHRDNFVSVPDFRIHLGGFRCALDADAVQVGVQKQNKKPWLWGKLKD